MPRNDQYPLPDRRRYGRDAEIPVQLAPTRGAWIGLAWAVIIMGSIFAAVYVTFFR